jgi:hypothetical protein
VQKVAPTVIKRGFLNSSKSSLYGDKIPTIRPAAKAIAPQSLTEEQQQQQRQQQIDAVVAELEKATIDGTEPSKIVTRSTVEQSAVASSLKAVTTTVKAKVVDAGSGSSVCVEETRCAVPVVVCKHREAVSMGDFEAMKQQTVGSRRCVLLVARYSLQITG